MDMSWQALLQEAAATSLEKTADTLAAAENDNCACVDLHQQQIHELSKKILLLPHQGCVLLLSRYCFRLSPEETEMFFHLENAKGRFRFYKELLSSSMGVEAGHMISDDTFGKACHITLKDYLRNELEADTDDKAAGNSRTHIAFRKDFEESLMGRFREDIIRSWGASDLLFSGINADGWYLDDDKNRGISLTYDGDGYVCEVVIWSGEKETGVDR